MDGTEKELVEFLYNLGASNSLIRVHGLAVRPDPPRQRLSAEVTLVASYQKAAPKPAAPASKPDAKGSKTAKSPAAASATAPGKSTDKTKK